MKKFTLMVLMFFVIVGLIACQTTTTSTTSIQSTTTSTTPTTTQTTTSNPPTTTTTEVIPLPTIGDIVGLEDIQVIKNHYFHPLKGVLAFSSTNESLLPYFQIFGHVDYGTPGVYSLSYRLEYNGDVYTKIRTVTVIEGTYSPLSGSRTQSQSLTVSLGSGSYLTGSQTSLIHPVQPTFLENDLYRYAVPSNGWWTTLITQNYGGSNGIYQYPIRSSFNNSGVEITHSDDGFVQYWNPGGLQTIAQFALALKDMTIKTTDLSSAYRTQIVDYSDFGVRVAMRNNGSFEDKMVITYTQGSPYVFAEVANKQAPYFVLGTDGVDNYEYYQLDGTRINDDIYVGSSLIVKMVRRHVGYQTTPPANVGSPIYKDRYFLVSTPTDTAFTFSSNHPFGLKNRVSMILGQGNYFSVVPIHSLTEAPLLHSKGYTMGLKSHVDFAIDYQSSEVITDYRVVTQTLKGTDGSYFMGLLPHQYRNAEVDFTSLSYRTVRGTMKVAETNYFQTKLQFHGLLPSYTLPQGSFFNATEAAGYLDELLVETNPENPDNFYNDPAPYWNSKAIYPLAQGLIIASQLGDTQRKAQIQTRLRAILVDWFSYSGSGDKKVLYYNSIWGTTYYSNNDFNTASELSDHAFTHGYLIFGSAVLAMYDSAFQAEYGGVVDLLVNDYLFTQKNHTQHAYLRSFDPWAGHSWAHGFGFFAEGNNLESTGEALNSWVAGYLWGLATNNIDRIEAAIYGFTTELSAVKEYWFDYHQENWKPEYSQYAAVAGIVWNGKHDYATWFGANPTFIYGIQWLPSGEYLTNYARTAFELSRFTTIYQKYLQAKNNQIDTWYSNMWTIQAIINPSIAISKFQADKIRQDDYPAELAYTYWMIHALDSLGYRTEAVWQEVHPSVASSIYKDANGVYQAMVWNASSVTQSIRFYGTNGVVHSATIPAQSFSQISFSTSS